MSGMDAFKPTLFAALWAASVDPAKTLRLITWPTAGRVLPKVFDALANQRINSARFKIINNFF